MSTQPGDWQALCPGEYLGWRLGQLGCDTVFTVPGDFNLPVLDALALVPGLRIVNCNSELACAYAADGYARARPQSLGCCVTTFMVGALSAINGVAGSFAEELPVLHIVGVPATFQYSGVCTLHHTLGNAENMSQEVDCFRPVTCYQTILRSFFDARYLIDKALTKCLQHKKPVLMEVCRDLPMTPHASFGRAPPHMTPFATTHAVSDPTCLQAAVGAAQAFFAEKHLPLVVLGRRARYCQQAVRKLVDTLGWGVVVLHDAKGMFDETHPAFIGTYSPFYTSPVSVRELYEAADAILFVGTHFNELSTGAPPDQVLERRSVLAYKSHVLVAHSNSFSGVTTEDFLQSLAGCMPPNSAAVKMFQSLPALEPECIQDPHFSAPPDVPLKMDFVMQQIQGQLLDGQQEMAVLVDTGDSMFRTQQLKLPAGTPYEVQMFAANIGFAAPAGLGFALGSDRRLLVMGGDGGLQMTSGSLGDYVKCGSNAIWVCVNNDGYLIERYLSPIPEASYNYVQRWDYVALAEAMCNKGGKYKTFKVATEEQAIEAFREARRLSDHFVFIEVIVHKADAAPASGALRQGFMAHHFAAIPGYKHLNLGASLAGGGGSSSLTAGGCHHDERCASVGPAAGARGGGVNNSVGGAGSVGGGVVLGEGQGGSAAIAAADTAGGGGPAGSGGSGGVTSGIGDGVLEALGEARGPVLMSKMHHAAAGSSTCLVAVGEGGLPAAEAAGSTGGAAPGVGGGVKRQGSRLGLPPAKRPEAEGSE